MAGAWERLGRVVRAEGQRDWMVTHAQMPHAEVIEGSTLRVYFTSRNAKNQSHAGWFVMDLERPGEVLDLAEDALMSPGPAGRYDDAGVMTSCMLKVADRRRFYMVGLNVPTRVLIHNSIGMAEGPADGPPTIDSRPPGPVLDRNPANPYFVATPWVLRDGAQWRMWYMSGLDWIFPDGKAASTYDVRHATSDDGVWWRPDTEACLPLERPGELAIARPMVVADPGAWRMWHCHRGEGYGYRIGCADSIDGRTWTRPERHPLRLDPTGAVDDFDGDMTCYPFVFDHGGERWMLYCGDGYGLAGIGLARLKKEARA